MSETLKKIRDKITENLKPDNSNNQIINAVIQTATQEELNRRTTILTDAFTLSKRLDSELNSIKPDHVLADDEGKKIEHYTWAQSQKRQKAQEAIAKLNDAIRASHVLRRLDRSGHYYSRFSWEDHHKATISARDRARRNLAPYYPCQSCIERYNPTHLS